MSIEAMKQALELLEDLQGGCTDSDDGTVEALTIHCPEVIANLRAAIEQSENPVAFVQITPQREWAWMPAPIKTQWGHDMVVADLAIDNDHTVSIYCERDQIKSVEAMFAPQPQQVEKQEPMAQYDQTALELCEECGWRALIPGDGCLVCARQKAKPAAWVYPEFWDHLKQVNCGTAYRLPSDGMQPLYTAPAAKKPFRWIDTIIPGDRVIDNDDKTQARVSKLVRQRPAAPDYFKLEFDDGSYIDVTDNELIANYKPLPESQKPVAYVDERIHGWPDCFVMEPDPPHTVPLYTAPQEWIELTDDEARSLVNRATFGDRTNWQALVYMVDAKLKEKNHG